MTLTLVKVRMHIFHDVPCRRQERSKTHIQEILDEYTHLNLIQCMSTPLSKSFTFPMGQVIL